MRKCVCWWILCLVQLGVSCLYGESLIEAINDKAVYRDVVTFRVPALHGSEVTAALNGKAIPLAELVTVDRADYYELRVSRRELASGAVSDELVRFIVASSERANSEWGLPVWTPHPWIPSTANELAGARLQLMMPAEFPPGYEIPVVAWVKSAAGLTVRANGLLQAAGHPSVQIRRGVGSGFLEAAALPGVLLYEPGLPGVETSRTVTIETTTIWTRVSGQIEGTTAWGDNQRVHVTADLVIPAGAELSIGRGTVVRLDPGVSITLDGRLTINGTVAAPVIFMPNQRAQPWGGVLLKQDSSELNATATIFTGSGANANWFSDHGYRSHRPEECLFFCEKSPRLTLTDCAAIDLAGQLGHAVNGGVFQFTRCLIQRCSTGGEYTGSTFTANDSAFIECPKDTPDFVDGDNDALYLVSGTLAFTNTLFGWVKDDGIDCGASGAGTLTLQDCWFESIFHEAVALSGAKTVTARDSVFMDCGQGLEVGYDGPFAVAEHCLATGNLSGMRFGDNYNWAYIGYLTVTNSLLLNNYRDVFGHTWNTTGTRQDTNQWVERLQQMDIRGNYLTAVNSYHPHNAVWEPSLDGWRLAPFLTTSPGAKPGAGIALYSPQMPEAAVRDGIPVRLSSFVTNRVALDCVVEIPGRTQTVERVEFQPGETRRTATVQIADIPRAGIARIQLRNAQDCEITGLATAFIVNEEPLGAQLGWARFHQELVLYWRDPAFDLAQAGAVDGSWERLAGHASPVTLPVANQQQYYRLIGR